MSIIVFLIYNLLLFPLFFVVMHLLAVFNGKIREGVVGRYHTIASLRRYLAEHGNQPQILLHCASMGEFEHIKPVIGALKQVLPSHRIIVTFFSPSGFRNVKSFPGVDHFAYIPFDWWFPVLRFYHLLKPKMIIIARYDAWPNQIWLAKLMNIPLVLANASMSGQAARMRPYFRWFQSSVYRHFTVILCVSRADADNYQSIGKKARVTVVGDTKFDQALIRAENAGSLSFFESRIIDQYRFLVAGSTWPQDEAHLIPACISTVGAFDDLLCIICPHEPTAEHLQILEKMLDTAGYRSIRLSRITGWNNQRFILVDSIGILASLYSLATVAYVGGSFYQNVHNVLEPAAHGIPVIIGPVNQNSQEAQQLKAVKAIIEVPDREAMEKWLKLYFERPDKARESGNAAKEVIARHSGATSSTVKEIYDIIDG